MVFEQKKNDSIGKTGRMAHFGFRLKDPNDMDEIAGKVKSAGGTILDKGEFLPGSPYLFFKDLDGYEVEVWYELLRPGVQ